MSILAFLVRAARFDLLELQGRWTIIDLAEERVADPHVPWTRADAAAILEVLAARPGYAVEIPWRSIQSC